MESLTNNIINTGRDDDHEIDSSLETEAINCSFSQSSPADSYVAHSVLHSQLPGSCLSAIDSIACPTSPIESIFVNVSTPCGKPLTKGVIYRPPNTDPAAFNVDLENILPLLSDAGQSCHICGDFNLDLLKVETHRHTSDFLNVMSSYLFRPLIEVPTRFTLSSATLIDNIFTNSTVYNEHPGVFMADI